MAPNLQSTLTPAGTGSQVDNELVTGAYRKLMARQKLTESERRALKQYEKQQEEVRRWKYYRSIPQKHWRTMSGRQTKQINEQAERYDIPFGGSTIDLPAVVRRIHDFLAENAHKLAREDDVLLQGAPSPALEKYREERAKIARLERLEREGKLLPRHQIREFLARVATLIRDAGERVDRQYGAAAAAILYEALDEAQREIERTLGGGQEADADASNSG
jgi:hypothetical protein